MKQLANRLARSGLVRNTAALYGVQISRKLIPLIILPYLARTLGPTGWGLVAFAQSLAEFNVLVIEFGFNLSATREIAQNRDSPETCGRIMAGVLGAQLLLAFSVMSVALIASHWIPPLRENPKLMAAGLFYAVAQGLTPLWFFQGLEKLRLAAALEISGKLLAMFAILLLVRSPGDGWIALLVQGLAPVLAMIVGITVAYRVIPFCWPSPPLVADAIRSGWRMFLFRSGESLYGAGNSFLLGLFAPPALVGYFASAEKISRAGFGLLNPIREALYPRLSSMVRNSPQRAARLARAGAMVTVAGGLLLGAFVFAFAPPLVRLLMGPGFEPAIPVLRVLALLPPILSITHSVGLQWLLPHGRDAEVNRIILTAGALNLTLAVLLAPRFAHLGMAWSVVCTEAFVCCSMVRAVFRSSFRLRGSLAAASLPLT